VKNLLKKFRKSKRSFIAVNKLNFGIKNSTCFGLLGLNGAGKTTREANFFVKIKHLYLLFSNSFKQKSY
jgi:ABC-type uncharacterized transport system ATPase subunit